jgi:hypothetical protein
MEKKVWWWNPRSMNQDAKSKIFHSIIKTKIIQYLEQFMDKFEFIDMKADVPSTLNPKCKRSGLCNAFVLKMILSILEGKEFEASDINDFAMRYHNMYKGMLDGTPDIEYDFNSGGALLGGIGGIALGGAVGGPGGALLGGTLGAVAGGSINRRNYHHEFEEDVHHEDIHFTPHGEVVNDVHEHIDDDHHDHDHFHDVHEDIYYVPRAMVPAMVPVPIVQPHVDYIPEVEHHDNIVHRDYVGHHDDVVYRPVVEYSRKEARYTRK